MIFLSIGMPSRFSEWCESLFHELLTSCSSEPVKIANADSLEFIGQEALAAGPAQLIVVSRQPQAGIAKLLRETEKPFMILLDDPCACAAALERDYGYDHPSAVRSVANSCASIIALAALPNAFVLRRADGAEAARLARAIAEHFRLGWSPEIIDAVAEQPRFASFDDASSDAQQPEQSAASKLVNGTHGEDWDAVLRGALDSLWSAVQGGKLGEIVWHRQLFYSEHGSPIGHEDIIDITGPPRCLFCGPYIRLGEGSWSCRLTIGCSWEAVGIRFLADIFAEAQLSHVLFEFDEPGVFEVEMPFVVTDPDKLVEVRLFSLDAALEGSVWMVKVSLLPLESRRLPHRIG